MGNCQGKNERDVSVPVANLQAIKQDENPKPVSFGSTKHNENDSQHEAITATCSTVKHEIEPTETETTRSHDSVKENKSSSDDGSPSPPPPPQDGRKTKRGYSSGGSSEGLGVPTHPSGSVPLGDESTTSRRSVDVLRLSSMRNVLHANGDLTQAVVRLEVRKHVIILMRDTIRGTPEGRRGDCYPSFHDSHHKACCSSSSLSTDSLRKAH